MKNMGYMYMSHLIIIIAKSILKSISKKQCNLYGLIKKIVVKKKFLAENCNTIST